jgi:nitrite reductase/ring-hydroxylating ferredoxin subunit
VSAPPRSVSGDLFAAVTPPAPAPDAAAYLDVAAVSEIAEGTMKGVDVEGERVLVAQIEGKWCAIGGICTHQVAYLEDGVLEPGRVLCPRHGAAFDLNTGEPLSAPADMPVPVYDVCLVAGRILVSRQPR